MGFKYYDFENSSDNADWMLHNGNGSAGISTEDSHSGDYSLRLRGVSTSDNCYGEVGVSNPNEITYWVKLNSDWDTSGTYKDTLYVEYYDGSYHTVREISDDSAIDNWVQYTDSIPSNATKIRFRANITGSTEKCFIDDVIIYPDLDNKEDWEYYKQLDISNFDDNYQVKVTVYSGSGSDSTNTIYCDNKCSSFPNDIRFGTTSDPSTASQLPQWIEQSDSSSAIIWVRLPSTTISSIYMFIGNSNASQYSDANNTFIWFDDFSGNYHSLSDYTIVDAGDNDSPSDWVMDTTNKKIIQHSNIYDSGDEFGSVLLVGRNLKDISISVKIKEVDNDEIGLLFGYQDSTHYYCTYLNNQTTPYWAIVKDGANRRATNYLASSNSNQPNTTTVYKMEVKYYGNGNIYYYIDDNLKLNATDTSYESGDLGIMTDGCDEGEFHANFIVRKYSSPESTLTPTGDWVSLSEVCQGDIIISGNNCSICCFVNRWDTSDYTFTIETWLKKNDFNDLMSSAKPGAVGELYKILDRPYYYDKTWTNENTLKFIPVAASVMSYLRNTTVGYVRNIVASPLEGPSKYIAVKIECFVSGSTL